MFLRSILFCLCLFSLSTSLNAQKPVRKGVIIKQVPGRVPAAKYSISQLNGKWQEVKRTPIKGKTAIAFSDTLLMSFDKDKVELKDATSMKMTMQGTAEISAPNSLIVAGDIYSIRSLDKTKLVIDDGEFIRELHKKDQYYYETFGKIKVERDSFSHPINIDLNNMKGKWIVYSRQAAPGATSEQTALIKSLEINNVSADGIAFGQVTYYVVDITKTISCQLVTKDGELRIVSEAYIWNFFAYKADNTEFVFGETGKLIYFTKHF